MKDLADMSLADLDQECSDHSSGQTKRARESSDLYPPQQTSHRNVDNMKSLMICKEAKPRKRRLAQAPQLVMLGAVKASNQKLTITRKESQGDGGMDNMDLREIQNAITKMILCTNPGFLVHIECTFIFECKMMIICKDEKTLEWAKHVVEAIVPSLVVHQGLRCKRPQRLASSKNLWNLVARG